MLTPQQAKALQISPRMARIVDYALTRARDEFGFPVTLEFLQKRTKREINVNVRYWFAVAISIAGGDEFSEQDFKRVMGFAHHKSVRESRFCGRRKWSKGYWRGFAVRWDFDRVDVLEGVAA